MENSCISHQEGQSVAVSSYSYFEITNDPKTAVIIGAFHLDYLGLRPLKRPTLENIRRAMIGVLDTSALRKKIKQLVKDGWLETFSINEEYVVSLLKSKPSQNFDYFDEVCEWCGSSTFKTQEHHYPVRAKDGGTETVSICANCHFEFHQIADPLYFRATEALRQRMATWDASRIMEEVG